MAGTLLTFVEWLPLKVMAGLWALHLAVIGIGAVGYEQGWAATGLFNLDGEGRYFTFFSVLVLLAGATVALLVSASTGGSAAAIAFASMLGYMALDEGFEVHERFEIALGGDWPTLYLPLMVVAGVTALALLRRHRDVRGFTPLLVAGGACWAGAVVLEKLEWLGEGGYEARYYDAMMIPEELLEATGSFLFAVALVLVVRAALQRRGEWRSR